jgi:Cyclin, C-terminal domain
LFSDAKDFSSVWTPNLEYYSGYDVVSLEPTCWSLAEVLLAMETSELKTIYKKYLHKTRDECYKTFSLS